MHVHEVMVRPEEYFSGYFNKNNQKPEEEEQESENDFNRAFGRNPVEGDKMKRGLKDILTTKV